MTTVNDLPPLPSVETASAVLPWTARRMVAQAEPLGEGIVATVIDLLKFLFKCAGVTWVNPREAALTNPTPEQIAECRRWHVPIIREMATANQWCMAAPDITRSMFQDTGHDPYIIDGLDIMGFGPDRYDRFGFDETGRHRDGRMRSSGPDLAREKADREGKPRVYNNGRNASGYDPAGYDPAGYDEKGYNAAGVDRWNNKREDVEPLTWQEILAHYRPDMIERLNKR